MVKSVMIKVALMAGTELVLRLPIHVIMGTIDQLVGEQELASNQVVGMDGLQYADKVSKFNIFLFF